MMRHIIPMYRTHSMAKRTEDGISTGRDGVMLYIFDHYELDTRLYELRRAGTRVKLERKVFTVLVYLVEHRDHAVTKDELLEHVWPDEFVAESSVERCVSAARQALGDDAQTPRYIETVRTARGYRFIAPVEVHPLDPAEAENQRESLRNPSPVDSEVLQALNHASQRPIVHNPSNRPALPAPISQYELESRALRDPAVATVPSGRAVQQVSKHTGMPIAGREPSTSNYAEQPMDSVALETEVVISVDFHQPNPINHVDTDCEKGPGSTTIRRPRLLLWVILAVGVLTVGGALFWLNVRQPGVAIDMPTTPRVEQGSGASHLQEQPLPASSPEASAPFRCRLFKGTYIAAKHFGKRAILLVG
jgi:DNA-binding winged helix-turn-helix (wHTH) protein